MPLGTAFFSTQFRPWSLVVVVVVALHTSPHQRAAIGIGKLKVFGKSTAQRKQRQKKIMRLSTAVLRSYGSLPTLTASEFQQACVALVREA